MDGTEPDTGPRNLVDDDTHSSQYEFDQRRNSSYLIKYSKKQEQKNAAQRIWKTGEKPALLAIAGADTNKPMSNRMRVIGPGAPPNNPRFFMYNSPTKNYVARKQEKQDLMIKYHDEHKAPAEET